MAAATQTVAVSALQTPARLEVRIPPEEVSKDRKVALLTAADAAARSAGGAITQVSARYGDGRRRILVADSDGLFSCDDQVRTLFSGVVRGHRRHRHADRAASRRAGPSASSCSTSTTWRRWPRRAAQRALTKLTAQPAPSGTMPVVVGPGGGGVLFHEACGHGLEADLVAKSASVFAGRLGETVAAPMVTLVDDGTMAGEWGHYGIDDEGKPAARNVLIADGVLTDLHVGPAPGPQGGPGQLGQRPAPELPAPAPWCG